MFRGRFFYLIALTLLSACSQRVEIDYDLLADKVTERLRDTPYAEQERGITNPANGHRYELIEIMMPWQEARAYAERLGGYLATVTSLEERNWIYQTFPHRRFWLGGTDEVLEGDWQWITGEKWDYTDWGEGEPNNFSGLEEDALDMSTQLDESHGLWNDMFPNGLGFMTSFLVEFGDGSASQ